MANMGTHVWARAHSVLDVSSVGSQKHVVKRRREGNLGFFIFTAAFSVLCVLLVFLSFGFFSFLLVNLHLMFAFCPNTLFSHHMISKRTRVAHPHPHPNAGLLVKIPFYKSIWFMRWMHCIFAYFETLSYSLSLSLSRSKYIVSSQARDLRDWFEKVEMQIGVLAIEKRRMLQKALIKVCIHRMIY